VHACTHSNALRPTCDAGCVKYSNALVSEISAFFAEQYGLCISQDEALGYLDSLADLFLLINQTRLPALELAPLSTFSTHPSLEQGVGRKRAKPLEHHLRAPVRGRIPTPAPLPGPESPDPSYPRSLNT
jgi:hypothetical protein